MRFNMLSTGPLVPCVGRSLLPARLLAGKHGL